MKTKLITTMALFANLCANTLLAAQYDILMFNQNYTGETHISDLKELLQFQNPHLNLSQLKLTDVILFAKSKAGSGKANFQLNGTNYGNKNVPQGDLRDNDLSTFHSIRLANPNVDIDINGTWAIGMKGNITLAKVVVDLQPIPAGPIQGLGYNHLPKAHVDVNGDGYNDYCRFVGDAPKIFLSCQLGVFGGYSLNPYGFNSVQGLDIGYYNEFAKFSDVNGDNRLDYCRLVGDGNQKFISCNLAEQNGFSTYTHGFNSIKGIDMGYKNRPRDLVDVNGDGRADFCRFVGDAPNIRQSCNFAEPYGFHLDQYNTMN